MHLALLFLLLLALPCAHAAGTGKVVAHVTSQGLPLPGATFSCLEPPLAGAADAEGMVILLGLPPGPRLFRASHLGLTPRTVQAIVISGETSRLELALEPGPLTAPELTVQADRQTLPMDRTAHMAVLDGTRMEQSAARGVANLLTLEAGLTRDERGDLHVRGGRAGELKFLVDGLEVQDPWSGQWRGVLSEGEVQELVLVAGAFNAEYGDAMSGVVNIVTRHGAPSLSARLRLESPGLLASPWRRSSPFEGVVDEDTLRLHNLRDWSPPRASDLLVDLPGRTQLSLAGPLALGWEGRLAWLNHAQDSHLPHGYLREGDLLLGLGRALAAGGRLDLAWERSRAEELAYAHVWKYLPGNQARQRRGQDRLQATLSRNWTPRLLSVLRASWQRHAGWSGVLDDQGDPLPLDSLSRPIYRQQQDFYRAGNSSTWESETVRQLRLGAEATLQAGRHHEWKGGAELRRDELSARTIHNAWADPAASVTEFFDDRVSARPRQAAAFLQDKLEFQHIVVNAGLRLDWRDPALDWLPDPLHPFVEEDGVVRVAAPAAVDPQWALSPRLGLAFPFGDEAVLHAAWGEFLQFAPLNALYGNRELNLAYARVPLVGNPRVKPQRTTAWETGLNRRLEDGTELGLSAWYKDLRDLLSTREVIQYTRSLVVYHNTDYANVRGVDFSWSRPLGRAGRLRLDYTWMSARGNAAEPVSGLIRAEQGEEEQFNEFPLDYEQAHDLAGSLSLGMPHGLQLELAAEAGSGLPYTPFLDVGVTVPTNSAQRPWTLRTDGALRWSGELGPGRVEAWLAVENLLDRRNVVRVYAATGKPFDDPRGLIGSTPDALHDPSRVEAPRQLRLGLAWGF